MKDNKYIRALLMSVVIIIAMSFVMDFSDFLVENSDNVIKLGVNPSCNSSIAICSASRSNNGEFQRISFSIKKTASSEPNEFKIMLTAKGFDFEGIESILVRFEIMAENNDSPIVLLVADKSTHQVVPEKWSAITQLTHRNGINKDWRAIIRLKSSNKEYQAEFPFSLRDAP